MKSEKIVSIKRIGILPTVDIEVDSINHIYYGNGIATSNSHAIEYGLVTYWCAYAKSHFLVPSFTAWLAEAPEKQNPFEEVADLVSDAKTFGVEIYPPNILEMEENFYTDGEVINFGISNIRGIGHAQVNNLISVIRELEDGFKPLGDWTWYEFLILAGPKLSKTVVEGLINVGGFRHFKELRSKLLAEYGKFQELKDGEVTWIRDQYNRWTNLADAIDSLVIIKREKGYATKLKNPKKDTAGKKDIDRATMLEDLAALLRKPITPYRDNPAEIAANEERLLGVALTCSIADAKPGERYTCSCKDVLNNPGSNQIIVVKVKVEDVRSNIIKNPKSKNVGKEMAYLKVSDGTCSLEDISCFPDQWEGEKDEEGETVRPGFKNILQVGRVLEIQLERGFKKNDNRLHVKEVWEI